jgi:hypothetical protein
VADNAVLSEYCATAEPRREGGFVLIALSQRKHMIDDIRRRQVYFDAIQFQEQNATGPCRALVGVVERVISR